jgi:hypothetical protein
VPRSKGGDRPRPGKAPLSREGLDEPFGPPPMADAYRCTVGGTDVRVNAAMIEAGMGMAQCRNEDHEGFLPTIGCPGGNGQTMVDIDQD